MHCTTAPTDPAWAGETATPSAASRYIRAAEMGRQTRESKLRRILFGAAAIAILALAPVAPVRAELSEVEVIFIKADRNGDLVLNKAEVLLVGLIQFDQSDSDKDNLLEKQEAGDLSKDPEFSDNDTNKDGALSVEEMIEEKLADFKAADTDGNGFLTVDEVKKFYESKK